ncbi:MAG: hypothetical protein NZL87_07235, partial [Thermomicrobium sp.]|nr:hypothetical protein [Thermomicrobium sp.]
LAPTRFAALRERVLQTRASGAGVQLVDQLVAAVITAMDYGDDAETVLRTWTQDLERSLVEPSLNLGSTP